jgi:hypothetical protein
MSGWMRNICSPDVRSAPRRRSVAAETFVAEQVRAAIHGHIWIIRELTVKQHDLEESIYYHRMYKQTYEERAALHAHSPLGE